MAIQKASPRPTAPRLRFVKQIGALGVAIILSAPINCGAQSLDDIPLPAPTSCFGLRTIVETQALSVCAALNSKQNMRARELAEQWLRQDPLSAAAHYTLAEVLLSVEGNVTRALYHLNQAETNSIVRSLDDMLAANESQPENPPTSSPFWHYLTLNQLSSVHQLIGNQEESLRYLDALSEAYDVDLEAYKGWPLIKLGRFEEAAKSARLVLASEELDEFSASQAWNTLCAAELAAPNENLDAPACDMALQLDEAALQAGEELNTVTLTNAAEVALSRLRIRGAEELIDRATRYPNPNSVANPWIQKLYLTLAQGRFEQAQRALAQMLIWRDRQEPLISVSNRAEHFLAGATLLLLAGYTEDSARLANSALNQPDRNGNFSADDSQKNAIAALISTLAYRADYEVQREQAAAEEGTSRYTLLAKAQLTRLAAWRTGRRAASLFADDQAMRNRLRPYAPLDVHIPEWMEPELVSLLGAGTFEALIKDAEQNGSFRGAAAYRHAYLSEVAAQREDASAILEDGLQALDLLPPEEVLLRARIQWHLAQAYWASEQFDSAMLYFTNSFRNDPSVARRLGESLPVKLLVDGSEIATSVKDKLSDSPRFQISEQGLPVEITKDSVCLLDNLAKPLSCYTVRPLDKPAEQSLATHIAIDFQRHLFGVGITMSKAQRSVLMGASVVLRSQSYGDTQILPDF